MIKPSVKRKKNPRDYPANAELEDNPRIKVRVATPQDIERLVEIDLECFEDVYGDTPPSFEETYEMLASRQSAVGELMVVGETGGVVEGFMTCQITDKSPEDFTNWEETTDNGYATTTHNPNGHSFYVINMTVTSKGSAVNLSDFIITNMYGRFVEQQKEKTLLLSRIPELSQWITERGIDFDSLDSSEQDDLANEYLGATKTLEGREVTYDGMLRRMKREGSQPIKIVRNGFKDPASRNYGVLCAYEGPIPLALRRNKIVSKLAGKALIFASQHPAIMQKIL